MAGGVRTAGHCDRTVRRFQGRDVVDAVTGHGYVMPFLLQRGHQRFLLLGRDPAENGIPVAGIGDILRRDQAAGVHQFFPSLQARLAGNAGDGAGIVPGNHLELHPLLAEIPEGPTPVFLPGEFHGQKSLVSYSPWGRKESDTTEQLTHTQQPNV